MRKWKEDNNMAFVNSPYKDFFKIMILWFEYKHITINQINNILLTRGNRFR